MRAENMSQDDNAFKRFNRVEDLHPEPEEELKEKRIALLANRNAKKRKRVMRTS